VVAVGTALLASSPRGDRAPSGSSPVPAPGPASTTELEAALREQVGEPDAAPLERAAALPAIRSGGAGPAGMPPLPADSPDPASPSGAWPAEPDGQRRARLADEAERRRADILASPILTAVAAGRSAAGGLEVGTSLSPGGAEAVVPGALRPGQPRTLLVPASGADTPASRTPRVEGMASERRLPRGTVLPAVLLTEVRSDLPGTLIAQVTQTVWDAVSGDRILVPQGARLIGEYGSDLRPGRERLLAVFTRLVWPDGRTADLGRLPAVDAQGRSGLVDQADSRFLERFGSGFLVAGLAALLAPRDQQPSTVVVVPAGAGVVPGLGAAAGTVLVETTRAVLEQSRSAPPRIIVRQGHLFNVIVQDDLPPMRADHGLPEAIDALVSR